MVVLAISAIAFAAPAVRAGDNKAPAAQAPAVTANGTARSAYRFAVTHFDMGDSVTFPGAPDDYKHQLSDAVCDMLTTELSKYGWDMVEREKLGDVIGEQDLANSGRVDKTTGPETGKILGADYLIVGKITQWGYKEQGGGFGGLLGNLGNAARYKETDAMVKIDFRVVNSRTSRIVGGSAGTAQGDEKNRGIALQRDWFKSIDFSQSEWTDSQIGKATRKAVVQIAQQLGKWSPNDGGAIADRAPVSANVLAVISADDFIIDQGRNADVRMGDTFSVSSITPVKNAAGAVVYSTEAKLGTATVVEVQEKAAKVHITMREAGAAKIKEGDVVHTAK